MCCESGCDTVCVSCIKANTDADDGKCAAVKADTDPDKECEDQAEATCGAAKDKGCNGDAKAPGCVLWDNKTVCVAASCAAGQQTPASLCDGKGVCVKAASTACTPYKCKSNDVVCLADCKAGKDADCVDGNYCEADKCVAKKDNGKACADPKECKSGSCVDLFCCDTACAGKCEACGLQGSEGKCSFVAKGQDPADECPGGACNGAGACALDGAQKCVADKDCLSGFCPPQDLVCCDKVCSGTCEACLKSKTGGTDGVCGYVTKDTEPDGDCKGQGKCWAQGVCLACGETPLAPGGKPCPKECTSCDQGFRICTIKCQQGDCTNKALACPAGYDCDVQCTGLVSCKGATITCPDSYDCKVACSGSQACQGTKIACSTLGTCNLTCDQGQDHCKDAQLTCGTNACTATCNDPKEPKPAASCGNSCQCTQCQ
ncbi:MAG: hypothetical protein HY744_16740 [Deltaproteobacteria bacterium]|nr:hypothetical protein [Deltaproteobacteria bacterium]